MEITKVTKEEKMNIEKLVELAKQKKELKEQINLIEQQEEEIKRGIIK